MAETEARLRGIFRRSVVDWLAGDWCFVEGEPPGSIAVIRNEGRASALRQIQADEGCEVQKFGVFRVLLPQNADDSGFVGWLASRIKAMTGSGLFVVCGHDFERGGIFDYYGVPAVATDAVRLEMRRLASDDRSTLDGVVMKPTKVAKSAAITLDTAFCFEQTGNQVSAVYGGGRIRIGHLAGTVDRQSGTITFRYLQTDVYGEVDAGLSTGEVHQLPDGRWRIVEHFEWDNRPGTGVNDLHEVREPLG